MKKKHVIALVCVLALAVTLFSSFAFAEAPEAENGTRAANRCYVKTATYLYTTATGAVSHMSLSVGQDLIIEGYGHTTTRLHVRMPDRPLDGYVLRSCIVETG